VDHEQSNNRTEKDRTRYSQQYKDEALALAERVGMSKAATQLGLKEAQLYAWAWRTKARQVMDTDEREQQLADENVRLKRQLAEQAEELALVKKAAAYFAKLLK